MFPFLHVQEVVFPFPALVVLAFSYALLSISSKKEHAAGGIEHGPPQAKARRRRQGAGAEPLLRGGCGTVNTVKPRPAASCLSRIKYTRSSRFTVAHSSATYVPKPNAETRCTYMREYF